MAQIVVITRNDGNNEVWEALGRGGFSTVFAPDLQGFLSLSLEEPADIVVVDTASLDPGQRRQVVDECRERKLPVLALVPQAGLSTYDFAHGGDDFVALPCPPQEVSLRVRQLLWRASGREDRHVLQFGDLQIDLERYEVSLHGRPVLLTYKEYQLLLLLASTPGRVYTRDVLLSRIWGYDYIGGTRTVDVHVRRLRSKLSEAQHPFVETVWNVGYRFRSPDGWSPPPEGASQ